ncbi:MAG TPA: methylmalonyl-CoA mutase subunit beta [Pseudolabrys sp.]|nr:methylmalonyl-CoA mutase subunit beta [Pseudolabrys sp.]
MTDELSLANEFAPATEAEWRKLVDAALKGADFDKRLVSRTYDDLRIEPLYARAAGAKVITGRTPGAAWSVMQRVDHPDPAAANLQALQDLENGATGLTLIMAGSVNANGYGLDASAATLARMLEGVQLDAGITVDFNLSPATRSVVRHFATLVKNRGLTPASVDMRASINPIGGFAASGSSPQAWSALSKDFAAMVADLASQGFRGPFAVADGRIVHNAGGSEAQELSFAIACAVEYLRALEQSGIAPDDGRGMIYFRLSADADEFLTIAKFRALRKLWARIEEACELTPKPAYLAAETAWRMMTRRDPYVNMLRTTIAIAAAGLGGANSITALPHTIALGLPDAFARRIARNTQLVLLEESNLEKVADPAAGSGAIEDITGKLCAAAWALFQDIEAAGGAWAAIESGLIQTEVASVRSERQQAVARRKDAITGTSDYPDLGEAPATTLNISVVTPPNETATAISAQALPRIRLAEPFERLRDASDRILEKTGSRPKVFLANLGTASDFTARATFAKSFYEAGGIAAVTNDGFKDQAAMVDAFKASHARFACLCSSDKIYEKEAAAAAQALVAAGAIVHLAGRPGEREAAWRQAGMKSFIYTGCDVLSTLQAAHDILNVK